VPARKILIVDDDDTLREGLVEQLSLYEEFETGQEPTAAAGVQRARSEPIDLVIMDVGLPDMDGREAVKLLRKGGFKAPVIMLTAQDSESDTILGLEAGANDYVTKPFRFAVLLARIRAQLRQHEQSEDAVFTVGRYTFRPSAKLMVEDGGHPHAGDPHLPTSPEDRARSFTSRTAGHRIRGLQAGSLTGTADSACACSSVYAHESGKRYLASAADSAVR